MGGRMTSEGHEGRRRGRGAGVAPGAIAVGVILSAVLSAGGGLEAQEIPAPTLAVFAGALDRDFRGEGGASLVGFRARLPLGVHVLVEPALTLSRFEDREIMEGERADTDLTLAMLDFQVQLQLPRGRVRPWVGLGAGAAADFRGERGLDEFVVSTFSASGGVAVELGERIVGLGELRGRSLNDFDSSAVQVGLGLGWRL